MKKVCFSVLFICFNSICCLAQDTRAIEADLCRSFLQLNYWTLRSHDDISVKHKLDPDSMKWVSDSLFLRKLLYYTNKYPATLTCPFKKMSNDSIWIGVLSSADSLFRIYNWDNELGGTMHYYNTVFQYQGGGSVKAYSATGYNPEDENIGPEYTYDTIQSFKANGKTYYLVTRTGIYSTADFMDELKLFTIENGKLNDTAHLIKTQTGVRNILSYEYRLNDPEKDFRVYTLHFNNADSTIYVPLVLDNGKKTSKFIRYKFTSPYFEKE